MKCLEQWLASCVEVFMLITIIIYNWQEISINEPLTWKKTQVEKKLLEETFLVLIKSNASLILRFFQLSPNVLLVAFGAFCTLLFNGPSNLFHLLTIQDFNIKDLKSLVFLLQDLVSYFAHEDAPLSFPSAVILEIVLNISFSIDGTQFELRSQQLLSLFLRVKDYITLTCFLLHDF